MKKLNWKRVFIVVIIPLLLVEVAWASYSIGSKPEQIQSSVDVEEFYKDNSNHYSNMLVKEVPSFKTKDRKTQEMVVVVDFGAWVQGGYQHIVTCNDEDTCDKPEGRTLIELDERNDKEARYYKEILDKLKKDRKF